MIPISSLFLLLVPELKINKSKLIGRVVLCSLYTAVFFALKTVFNEMSILNLEITKSRLSYLGVESFSSVLEYLCIAFFVYIFANKMQTKYKVSLLRALPFLLVGMSSPILLSLTFTSFWYLEGLINGKISTSSKTIVVATLIAILLTSPVYSIALPSIILSIIVHTVTVVLLGTIVYADHLISENVKVDIYKKILLRVYAIGSLFYLKENTYFIDELLYTASGAFLLLKIIFYIKKRYNQQVLEFANLAFVFIWLFSSHFCPEYLSVFCTLSILNHYFTPKISLKIESRQIQLIIKNFTYYFVSNISLITVLMLIICSLLLREKQSGHAFVFFAVFWLYIKAFFTSLIVSATKIEKNRMLINLLVMFWSTMLNIVVVL